MAVFAYKAQNRQYSRVHGTVTADTPRQARDLLRERGLTVEEIKRYDEKQRTWRLPFIGGSSASSLATAIHDMSTLLSVGIPLVEALETISKQSRGELQHSLTVLKDRVTAGANLGVSSQ